MKEPALEAVCYAFQQLHTGASNIFKDTQWEVYNLNAAVIK